MASCSSLLSEEHFQCSICLEAFTEPVSIPCGHNFCKACISNYWDTTDLCRCPLCKESFYRRPELRVNTAFRDIVDNVSSRKLQAKLGKMTADIDEMINTRSMKVQQIRLSVETSQRDADREISDSVEVCTALLSSIQRSQAELVQVVEEKQRAAEKWAEGFIKDLEQEITELKRRRSELDHLHLLQSSPSLTTPPRTKDWSQVSVHGGLSVGTLMRAASQLEDTLMTDVKKLCEAELRRIRQCSVDVTLDPDTAHPTLILSEAGKQVRHGDTRRNVPDNPERFDPCLCVLGKQSFSSGRFYYEVQVEGKTDWVLGVVRESVNRKGDITLNSGNGYWTIYLMNGDEYVATAGPDVLLSLREKPQTVGVFVDYEEGLVSFYGVEASSHIHSYTGCTFTESLYPFFSPCLNGGGENSAPLSITPPVGAQPERLFR